MPRALRSTTIVTLVLALLVALAATAAAARAPRQMQPQQLQAAGEGTTTLDGSYSVLGWVDAGRRNSIRVVDRAGDGRIVFQGRNIPFGRRGQARIPGGGGRFLVTGTRIQLEVRGKQQLSASGFGWARFRGEGEFAIVDDEAGEWDGSRISIGVPIRSNRTDRDNTAPAAPTPPPAPPAPAPSPEPAPAPTPSPGVASGPQAIGGSVPELLTR